MKNLSLAFFKEINENYFNPWIEKKSKIYYLQ